MPIVAFVRHKRARTPTDTGRQHVIEPFQALACLMPGYVKKETVDVLHGNFEIF